MCGICGRFNFEPENQVDDDTLGKMTNILSHRGPDDKGVFLDGAVGLGHRRLSIIDVTENGRQPMANEDESLWMVFNGEIYNFPQLRNELLQRGHHFRSKTDSEVILHLYEEKGVKCLQDLRGMFALGIWDVRARELFLARDRLGKKPLYYWLNREGIAFASEPKAFLGDPTFEPRPNLEAIWHYLTYQYVPSPLTAFQDVQKLPPAHYMLVRDKQVFVQRYWKLSYQRKVQLSEDAACDELLARLREAVNMRLISDVPLGAFLSGGLDSSAVVALMTEQATSAVKTFSVGFEEKEYDELPYARLVAQRFETEHHEFVVRPQAIEILPKLVWHYNEPYADSSAIPTYYLAQLTRPHVTVALNGDAGDENFAGYDRYLANVLAERYEIVPKILRRPLETLVRSMPGPSRSKSLLSRAKRFFEVASVPKERRYARWISHFHPDLKDELCTQEFQKEIGRLDSVALIMDLYQGSDARDFVDATLDVDVNTYLPDDLLVKVDIATMAHGLEGRSPFLDHVFMEFCASLPSHMKLRGRVKKYIFKRALRGLLPEGIIERPKMGFGVPLDHWFRHELRDVAYDLLVSPRATERGYFRKAVVKRLLDEHIGRERTWHYQLWNLLMLELWHETFIDHSGNYVLNACS